MPAILPIALSGFISLFTGAAGAIESPAQANVLVELFTSQGCSSCPAADVVVNQIDASHKNVVALEFHVDYWDSLVWGSAGQWKDPFSEAAYTLRQRRYNANVLDGRRGVYTPQAVVQGQFVEVGHRKRSLLKRIKSQDSNPISIHWTTNEQSLEATLKGPVSRSDEVWIAHFIIDADTQVDAGENHGKTLHNHNVVTHWEQASVRDSGQVLIPVLTKPNRGCALIIQEKGQGRVKNASYCP